MTAPKTTSKTLDPDKTRADLLQGALDEFSEKGFDGASLRNIGARVGITHGSIVYHYKTKEKLWFAAVDYLFSTLAKELAMPPADVERLVAGELDIFRDMLRRYVRYCAEHPEHARIMMQEAVSPTNRLREVVTKHLRGDHKLRVQVLDALKEQGALPVDGSPESLIYIITGACQNIFALASEAKLALDYDALSEDAIAAHAETIVALFCPYPDAKD